MMIMIIAMFLSSSCSCSFLYRRCSALRKEARRLDGTHQGRSRVQNCVVKPGHTCRENVDEAARGMTQGGIAAMLTHIQVQLTHGGNMLGDFVVLGEGVDERVHVDIDVEVDDGVVGGVEGMERVLELVQWKLEGKWQRGKRMRMRMRKCRGLRRCRRCVA